MFDEDSQQKQDNRDADERQLSPQIVLVVVMLVVMMLVFVVLLVMLVFVRAALVFVVVVRMIVCHNFASIFSFWVQSYGTRRATRLQS